MYVLQKKSKMTHKYQRIWITIVTFSVLLVYIWKIIHDQTIPIQEKNKKDQLNLLEEYEIRQILNSSVDTTFTDEIEFIQKARSQSLQTFCKNWSADHTYNESTLIEKIVMIDDTHRILLLSIPKSGCTVWKWTIYNSTAKVTTDFEKGQKLKFIHQQDFLQSQGFRTFMTLPGQEKERLLDNYFNILTVRHPLDRLESSYVDKIVNYQNVNHMYRTQVVKHKMKTEGRWNNTKVDLTMKVTFEDFLSYILVHINEHWENVMTLAMPCMVNYNFISKTETLNMDIEYIIKSRLSGNGKTNSFNNNRESSPITLHQGKLLTLFSELRDPEKWILQLMRLYQDDMDMFGYSYTVHKGKVYAKCTSYFKETICI